MICHFKASGFKAPHSSGVTLHRLSAPAMFPSSNIVAHCLSLGMALIECLIRATPHSNQLRWGGWGRSERWECCIIKHTYIRPANISFPSILGMRPDLRFFLMLHLVWTCVCFSVKSRTSTFSEVILCSSGCGCCVRDSGARWFSISAW